MNKEAIKAYNEVIIKNLRKRIAKLFADNKMPYDFSVDDQGYIRITVENGDWKHDHMRLQQLMKSESFVFFDRHIPDEENGDDSYSAVYLYR